ncbi:MAG: cytochrome c [Gammaproteobacteria bacterium]|nr:cytochrome c [Gammaproteobacteria bacterium]MBL4728617.1 cytochrome c [Gammaproteobacteria bacterium]
MRNTLACARNSFRLLTAIALFSCFLPASADVDTGRQLYRSYCSQCHGLDGTGNGINAPHLEVAPRNHTDRSEMITRTDEELFKAISEGGQSINKSVLMPNWGKTLTEEQITDIITFLRALCCLDL